MPQVLEVKPVAQPLGEQQLRNPFRNRRSPNYLGNRSLLNSLGCGLPPASPDRANGAYCLSLTARSGSEGTAALPYSSQPAGVNPPRCGALTSQQPASGLSRYPDNEVQGDLIPLISSQHRATKSASFGLAIQHRAPRRKVPLSEASAARPKRGSFGLAMQNNSALWSSVA